MVDPLSEKEFAGYAALLRGSTLLQRAVEWNLLEQASITQVQFEILMQLHDAPDGLRMAELADRLIVSRSGLSYQVTQLEKVGLLTRSKDSSDERGIVARITGDGRAMRNRVLPGHLEIVRAAFFDAVSADELQMLTDVLNRVAGRLE